MALISTRALTKRYPGGVTALDGLSVEIDEGIVGLVGANGAGKSTLIKILLGLLPSTEGEASVLGMDTGREGARIRELVGYMPEHDCLPADVSATEFVTHMARVSGLPAGAARERTADTLRHVGLYEERYRPIGGYSLPNSKPLLEPWSRTRVRPSGRIRNSRFEPFFSPRVEPPTPHPRRGWSTPM